MEIAERQVVVHQGPVKTALTVGKALLGLSQEKDRVVSSVPVSHAHFIAQLSCFEVLPVCFDSIVIGLQLNVAS